MAIEERIYVLPNQITPELRAAYEALDAAVTGVVIDAAYDYTFCVCVSLDAFEALRNALDAIEAAKRAAP